MKDEPGVLRSRRPFDFFEPGLVRLALTTPGHLPHIIYGPDWGLIEPSGWIEPKDPVTRLFFPKKGAHSPIEPWTELTVSFRIHVSYSEHHADQPATATLLHGI